MDLPRRAVAAAACAVVTVAAFWPAVGAPLLQWDDRANLVDNTRYQGFSAETVRWAFTTFHLGPWQPLSWLSWTADHAVWGLDPRGFHLTNVLLQAVCAALLSLLAHALLPRFVPALRDRPGLLAALAAGASLLWAVHPQRVESVAWATERRDVLSCAFLLASALAWVRHVDADAGGVPWLRRGAWWAAFLLFGASLLSKATAMGFVLVLATLDLHPFRRPLRGAVLAEKVPFALAGAAVAVLAWIGQSATEATTSIDTLSLPARVVMAAATVFHHAAVTVVPVGLRAHFQRPMGDAMFRPDLVASAAAAVLGVAAVVAFRRRIPAVATAVGSYLVLLAPVSGLAASGSHLFADRYSHQSTLAFGILVAGAVGALLTRDRPPVRPVVALVALAAAAGALATGAFRLTATWRSPQALWGRVLEFEPENWVAHEQLGKAAYDAGDRATAEAHLVRSIRSLPGRRTAPVFLALVRLELGRADEAEATIAAVLRDFPGDAPALRVLARIRRARGDTEGALAAWARAAEKAPDSAEGLREYGTALADAGRRSEAADVARRLVAITPRDPAARAFLGSLVEEAGDAAAAERLYREAVALDPRHALSLQLLGALLGRTGRTTEAETVLRSAVDVDPDSAASWATLSMVVARRGDLGGAGDLAVRAAGLVPADPGPRLQAAALYLDAGRKDDARAQATAARDLAARAGDAATARRAAELLARIERR